MLLKGEKKTDKRECNRCHKIKPIEEFYIGTRRCEQVRYASCAECYRAYRARVQREANARHRDARGVNLLYARRCGGCGKKLRWPSRNRGNLCNVCSRPAVDREKYIEQYADLMGMVTSISSCPGCAFIHVCQVRVSAGMWAVCEMPDHADLQRAQLRGIETDGRKIIVRQDQVKNPLVWQPAWGQQISCGEGEPLTMERVNKESLR